MKTYLRKNVPFNPNDEQEKELYDWLQKLPHGKFASQTKAYWLKKMKEEKNNVLRDGE